MKYKVQVVKGYFDVQENRHVDPEELFVVSEDRKNKLVDMGLVKEVKQVEEKKAVRKEAKSRMDELREMGLVKEVKEVKKTRKPAKKLLKRKVNK